MTTDTTTTPEPITDPIASANATTARILDDLARTTQRAVVVDSPPGAGKSTLVVRAARELVHGGERPIIVAQTNNQVDDLITRLAEADPGIPVGRLSSSTYIASPALNSLTNLIIGRTLNDLAGCQVIVGTAAKWATIRDTTFGWAILDESYQMRSDMLLRIVERFDRGLFVGDPGQLDPFTVVGTERWIGLPYNPTLNGVTVMLDHNPDIPVHRLPVSWRLPPSPRPSTPSPASPPEPVKGHAPWNSPPPHSATATWTRHSRWPSPPAGPYTNYRAVTSRAPMPKPYRPPRTSPPASSPAERSPPVSATATAATWGLTTSPSASPTATRPTWPGKPWPAPATPMHGA